MARTNPGARKPFWLAGCLGAASLFVFFLLPAEGAGRNAILFIGDGMGPEQVRAAGMYLHGEPGTLFFERFPHRAEVTTASAEGKVTDSAAAATAMATGRKVTNGVVSLATPGDGSPLPTILERSSADGRRVGLVTTTHATHATPAAFGAHARSRDDYDEIAWDYLTRSKPDVLLGGGGYGLSKAAAVFAGYPTVTTRKDLLAVDPGTADRLWGLFGHSHLPYEHDGLGSAPHLSEMARAALAILERDPDGFFLMVEGGKIDHACHSNDLVRAVKETIEFANAVQAAYEWAKDRDDTLILVTADHETGGLSVKKNQGAGKLPEVAWSSKDHTGANVSLYAWGPGSERISGTVDNTQIYEILVDFLAAGVGAEPSRAAGAADVLEPAGATR